VLSFTCNLCISLFSSDVRGPGAYKLYSLQPAKNCEFNVPGKTKQREKNPFYVRLSSKLNRATNSYLYDFNFEDWMLSVNALSYN